MKKGLHLILLKRLGEAAGISHAEVRRGRDRRGNLAPTVLDSKRKVRELRRQIKSSLYQRLALSTDKEGILALAESGHQILTAVKDEICIYEDFCVSLQKI